MNTLDIYIIAGEPSGDAIGAKLIKKLKQHYSGTIRFHGIGGRRMEEEGVKSLFPISELSLMGFFEILPHIPNLISRINQTANHITQLRPDMVITIDSPGFCFRLAKKIRSLGIKMAHYVAPTVWAYKPERAQKVAQLYDHILLLFPFEVKYFDHVGLSNTFVGHPIVEESFLDTKNSDFRSRHSIPPDAKLLCVMPGSRGTEIKSLQPIFEETIFLLSKKIPDLHVVIPTVATVAQKAEKMAQSLSVPTIVVDTLEEKFESYAASDAALVKSGTGALEISLASLPAVVAYKINALSYWYIKRLITVKYVNLINLILDKEVIPECIQENCEATKIANYLEEILLNNTLRNKQLDSITEALTQLGTNQSPTPSQKAAEAILKLIS